jgi:pyruvate kinase
MRKTRIVATFGPAIASEEKLRRLIETGVNIFRINCSHGNTGDFRRAARLIRRASREADFPVGLLMDISGPKLRLDRFDGSVEVEAGDRLTLTADKTDLAARRIAVNHPAIIKSLRKAHRVFMDDGNIAFSVESVGRGRVQLKAVNSGTISGGKGINLPDSDIGLPTITDKDRVDLKTAAEVKADFVALSFVRKADDIVQAREILKGHGGAPDLIAKLEKREAIERLDQIMEVVDGVMVARGDLGVEVDFEELPSLQKKIVRQACAGLKPVIVATQMLESMRFSPRATRAEINDVATAVFDFADAVMLSAETATGSYPNRTVATMHRIIMASERTASRPSISLRQLDLSSEVPLAIARSVLQATATDARLICAFTTSGFSAELISNLMPSQPVIALTPDVRVRQRLILHRSVYPVKVRQPKSFEDMLRLVEKVCRDLKLAGDGDTVVITGGAPFGQARPTNLLMLYEIGKG